ncbi:hypothetical protein [Nostoc sp. 'Peltigera membranacea cyanobiont' N6]|uniref:hypothetical protein n=1 Tax=Nostoc sp. 'Peltigera membranacea cyanobiont' N6 TaxID=1261031 RepID=UPI002158A053|nr:hypothetical protein [Nostoc sp. 'Peltigera membranacea cyanobiont' N6]
MARIALRKDEILSEQGVGARHRAGLQHLKSFNYLPQEGEQMQLISDHISRVYSDSLEETVKSLLQSLGKLNRPYLTAVEEKLLSVLESEYG